MVRNSECIRLPSQRTLRDYTYYTSTTIGFSAEVDKQVHDAIDFSEERNRYSIRVRVYMYTECVQCTDMCTNDVYISYCNCCVCMFTSRYVSLVMDEVHIKDDLIYDKHEGTLVGFANLGDTNNHLLQFEAALSGDSAPRPLANSMLVLMVRGLFSKLNFPYAQFACSKLSGDLLMDPVWEAISRLERQGIRVLSLTCDGASTNRRLWKLHTEGGEMIHKVNNIFAPEAVLFLFYLRPATSCQDYPELLVE